jgi:two-component system OmpR family sensor kinase
MADEPQARGPGGQPEPGRSREGADPAPESGCAAIERVSYGHAGEESGPRALKVLEQLLELPTADLRLTLTKAANLIAEALGSDKVDAFLHEPSRDSLVAVGSSTQPLSALEKRLGLDVLPVSNGGRVVHVFVTGQTFVTGQLNSDPEELRGVKEALKIRSKIGVPLEVGGVRRGMVMIASLQADKFTPADVRFAEAIVRWVGMVVHRSELMHQIAANAAEQGRRAAAEELVTVLAHDLRNLLTPIGARLNLLEARARRERRDADIKDTEIASKAVQRLSRMIGDILDGARIDQGIFRIEPKPLNLVALAEEVGRLMSTPTRPVTTLASEEVTIPADGDRLRQLLENLLSNAVQHSAQGRPVTVLVSSQQREDGSWAQVEVIDQGPGIREDLLPRIFERFTSGQESRGLGLGLYLAKKIAQAHGGDLVVQSPPGEGAHFILSLPGFRESSTSPGGEVAPTRSSDQVGSSDS